MTGWVTVRWRARLLAIGMGVGLLVGAEFALRILWELPAEEGVVWTSIDPYQVVGGVAETRQAFYGVLRRERFPAQKPVGTYRVFAIGGSTTFGYPFEPAVAWPRRLNEWLRELYAEPSVEVINVGGTSYGSSRALGVLRALVRYRPDLVVFCGGDAEFVEDSYRVSVKTQGRGRTALRSLYLSRLLLRVLPVRSRRPTVDAADAGAAGFLFSPTVHGTVYEPTLERRREVLARFRDNIEMMADLAEQEGFGLIVCTLPSNTATWPPDPDSRSPQDPGERARWKWLLERGRALRLQGDLDGALAVLREAKSLWGENATLRFELGRALLSQGYTEEAARHLALARDLDPSPVRATSEFNSAIRDLARRRGLGLADVEERYIEASGGGPVGEDLILDYAHPTSLGHAYLTRTVWRSMTRLGSPWKEFSPSVEARMWQEMVAGAGDEPLLDSNLAFVWGQIYLRKGQPERAAQLFREAIRQGYDLPYASLNLAAALVEMGDLLKAKGELARLVEERPNFAEPYPLLGHVLLRLGDDTGAVRAYRLALQHGARDRRVFLALGTLLLEGGAPGDAEEVLATARAVFPGECEVEALWGRSIEASGRGEQAASVYSELIRKDPGCHAARENLGVLLMNGGDWAAAEQVFRASIAATGSAFPVDHLNLGVVYAVGLGDEGAALEQFRTYARLDPKGVMRIPTEFRARLGVGAGASGETR